GLDPLLLEARLHEASQFDAYAEDSASGTRGLAAITPIHAEEAERGLGTTLDEVRPIDALEADGWLGSDRLRRFDRRPEVTLAALDSTERTVDGWLARPGADDPDVFVERIDFSGVRDGVRGVLAARMAYALTYSGALDPVSVAHVKSEPTAAWIKIARLA